MALRRLVTLQSHLLPSRSLAITAPLATRPLTAFKLGSAFSTAPPADMSEIKQLVDSTIAENNVVVFSKTYCPVSACLRGVHIAQTQTVVRCGFAWWERQSTELTKSTARRPRPSCKTSPTTSRSWSEYSLYSLFPVACADDRLDNLDEGCECKSHLVESQH
jgi:hypothetical protein